MGGVDVPRGFLIRQEPQEKRKTNEEKTKQKTKRIRGRNDAVPAASSSSYTHRGRYIDVDFVMAPLMLGLRLLTIHAGRVYISTSLWRKAPGRRCYMPALLQ